MATYIVVLVLETNQLKSIRFSSWNAEARDVVSSPSLLIYFYQFELD